jgi:hypothetical protein
LVGRIALHSLRTPGFLRSAHADPAYLEKPFSLERALDAIERVVAS